MSYVYAVSRLRGMENQLLDASFFSRLIDSATLEDALKALSETSYAQWMGAGAAGGAFDKIIDDEMIAICKELSQFVPDQPLITLFKMPYDFHNVKVLLKSLFKVRGGELEGRRHDLLSRMGSIPVEELVTAVESEECGFLPWGLGDVIARCWLLWDQTKNAQSVELLLDHHLFASMLKVAEALHIPDVTAWVRCKIDAENLRSLVRLQRMNYDATTGEPFFHPGGTLRPDDVAHLLNEPLESWSKLLSHTDIGASLEALGERADLSSSLSDIAKALDDYLIRVLEKSKYATNAPEYVLRYLLNKETEARNLRISLVCVANGLNREFARRLLSHVR